MIKKISHIAVVVPELEEALSFWVDALGLSLSHVEHVVDQGVDVAFLPAGESDIELLEPIDSESGVARYLQKRGPGMHHICFEVDDIKAALARLKAAGVPLINEEPTIGTGGKKIAFVHPKGTGGVLVELYQLTPEEPARRLERLDEMRRRLSEEGQVYAAGVRAFLASLRYLAGNGSEKHAVSQEAPPNGRNR
ncbi:MAG TPA: methylmalonyl-CoA epimerase [Anaerolineae bacterium]